MTDNPVTTDAVAEAADRLRTAQAGGTPCPPVRDLIGRDDTTAAYAVQQLLTRARPAGGERVVGRKIGLTAPAVQAQLGVDQPDVGVLFDTMRHEDGAAVPAGAVLQPRAEAEIARAVAEELDRFAIAGFDGAFVNSPSDPERSIARQMPHLADAMVALGDAAAARLRG